MMTIARAILLTILALLGACGPALAGTITLRASATIDTAREVSLGDVASLDGPEAERLASVSLGPVDGPREVTLAQVRAALDAEKVNWGRLALRGQSCAVRVAPARAEPRSATGPDAPDAASGSAEETIRDRVVATLRELFGAEPDAIRVTLDDAGSNLLARSINGRRVDVETSSANSARLAVRVWMYEGDRLAAEGTLRADVSLKVDVFTLTTALGRGDRIEASMLSRATVWMSPTGAPPIREEAQAAGAAARTRLDAGTILRTEHVEAPIVVRRGDLVSVHALAGSMVLKTKARAMADAREGDLVELSRSRDRKPFLARVAGPGLAILEAGDDRRE